MRALAAKTEETAKKALQEDRAKAKEKADMLASLKKLEDQLDAERDRGKKYEAALREIQQHKQREEEFQRQMAEMRAELDRERRAADERERKLRADMEKKVEEAKAAQAAAAVKVAQSPPATKASAGADEAALKAKYEKDMAEMQAKVSIHFPYHTASSSSSSSS
jgi:vacuolar-type H+-ATPase subunit I/STV1